MSGNLSPLPWTGNKACISDSLLAFMPQHDIYIEPCCGSAEFLLRKPRVKEEIINDYNSDVVNFFSVIQNNKAYINFVGRAMCSANSEAQFIMNKQKLQAPFKAREIITDDERILDITDDELNRAVAFFENQIYSFSSTGKSFGIANRSPMKKLQQVLYANYRLQGVCILNRDYKKVILEQSKNNCFIFLDPPYHGTEDYYNNIDFAENEHIKLFETVATVDKKFKGSCKVLITYNNDAFIRQLADKYGFDTFVVKRLHNMQQSSNPGSMFEELIIANYDLKAQAIANNNFIFEESRQLSLFDDNYYN